MKENETLDQKKLESINGEIFQSFDPDDAPWITGGESLSATQPPSSPMAQLISLPTSR
jgi:hypothetical protein